MKIFCSVLLAGFFVTPLVSAKEVEGVSVPETKQLAGQTLQLNGTGVRVFRFLGIPVKAYVAAFYTPGPLRSAAAVMKSAGPMQFDFTFLRSVGQAQVTEAWQKQLEASVSHTYKGYEKDRDAFVSMFGPLKSGGTETVQLVGTDTIIIDQGEQKGTIPGRNFQLAFLSMWFGENAVSSELKAGLLGN